MGEAEATAFWKAVHAAFDPLEPVHDPSLRAQRDQHDNPMTELDARLRLPIEFMCYAVAGGIGSGKSTELLAAAERMTSDAMVVYIDLWRHFEFSVRDPGALDHLQPWELIGLIGLATVKAGRDRFDHPWGDELEGLGRALERLRATDDSPSTAKIDVGKLVGGLTVIAGGAAAGSAGSAGAASALEILKAVRDSTSWQWKLGLRDRAKTSDQDQQVRDVLDATNRVIEALRAAYQRKLVFVVDGLDRVRVAATFEDLFVESNLLRELKCDVVVSLELSLVQRYRTRLRVERTFELANVPVARRDDPQQHGDGVQFFHDLVRRRLDTLEVTVPPHTLPEPRVARLAWCSGGRLRDFMRLVREIAIEGLMRPQAPIDDERVKRVIDRFRREKESGLNADQIATLKRVLEDPDRRLPGGEVALELLDQHLLLPYPNESVWYLPHALLLLKLLAKSP